MYGRIGTITLCSLSDIIWSCRLDALNSILSNFTVIHKTQEKVSEKGSINGIDISLY